MLHFPSTANGHPNRSDSLNATQSKSHSNPFLLKIEEELHDARRVQSHGQEEDLRTALNMVINRVAELSSMLNEAYKAQADLEVQLNVAKSNLQLVIANNEMLEEALKRETNGRTQDVGWRRASVRRDTNDTRRPSDERSKSVDCSSVNQPGNDNNPGSSVGFPVVSTPTPPTPAPTPPSAQDNRFFRFRFTGSISSRSAVTRPTTPAAHHLTSPSMPSLPTIQTREIEELTSQLEKERVARKTISDEKAALEAELESLSQALFEEANKMVATERMKRAETEEELKEARLEQEALRGALRLVEGENCNLREATAASSSQSTTSSSDPDAGTTSSTTDQDQDQLKSRLELVRTRLRSSSQVAMKSPITSPRRPVSNISLPTSPSVPSADPEVRPHTAFPVLESGPESHLLPPDTLANPMETSNSALPNLDIPPRPSPPQSPLPRSASVPTLPSLYDNEESSPWADVPARASVDLSATTPRNALFSAAPF